MRGVLDYFQLPNEDDLRTEIPHSSREFLTGLGVDVSELEEHMKDAAAYANDFNPALRKFAYDAKFLHSQGAPIDDAVAGSGLYDLSKRLDKLDEGTSANPIANLLRAAQESLPDDEVRVMSPMPGDREISPADVAGGKPGLTIVAYSPTERSGLAPGVFAKLAINEARELGGAARVERNMGGDAEVVPFSVYVDEGYALEPMAEVVKVVTDGRQNDISLKIASTSNAHLRNVLGPERAAQVEESVPVRIELTPTPETAKKDAELFGEKLVTKTTETVSADKFSTKTGSTRSTNVQKEPVVTAAELANQRKFSAVLHDKSAAGKRLTRIRLPAPGEPNTPVADAQAEVKERGLKAPWEEMRPEVAAKLAEKRRQAVPAEPAAPAVAPPEPRDALWDINPAEPAEKEPARGEPEPPKGPQSERRSDAPAEPGPLI